MIGLSPNNCEMVRDITSCSMQSIRTTPTSIQSSERSPIIALPHQRARDFGMRGSPAEGRKATMMIADVSALPRLSMDLALSSQLEGNRTFGRPVSKTPMAMGSTPPRCLKTAQPKVSMATPRFPKRLKFDAPHAWRPALSKHSHSNHRRASCTGSCKRCESWTALTSAHLRPGATDVGNTMTRSMPEAVALEQSPLIS
jgi:hypothetical protein